MSCLIKTLKARYMAWGYQDKDNDFSVHDVDEMKFTSYRAIISILAVLKFQISSQNATKALVQFSKRLARKVDLTQRQGIEKERT